MATPVYIQDGAAFGFNSKVDRTLEPLAPIVDAIATGIHEGREFSDVVRQALAKFPKAAKHFEFDPQNISETFRLREKTMFMRDEISSIRIEQRRNGAVLDYALKDAEDLRTFGELLRACASGLHSARQIQNRVGRASRWLVHAFREYGILGDGSAEPRKASFSRPGIYRLQHASLLYRSDRAGILVDPHIHSIFEGQNAASGFRSSELAGLVDAIVVSHFHGDHFHLPSIALFPRDIPIFVPQVPRGSILASDMAGMLRALGFRNVHALPWYSQVAVADNEIHILPFFGEQPLLSDAPSDPRVRNWGNTYFIRNRHYSSWFLIDSGDDALGKTVDVAHHVRRNIGPLDTLLSNLRPFNLSDSFGIAGAGKFWLSLSPKQMRAYPSMAKHCVTLAPEGVAEVCKVAGAKYYLPYAHWWGELGATPSEDEKDHVEKLRRGIQTRQSSTEIVDWKIGDRFVPTRTGYNVSRAVYPRSQQRGRKRPIDE